jgi:hypothetical protein
VEQDDPEAAGQRVGDVQHVSTGRCVSEATGGLLRALGIPPAAVPVDRAELAGLYRTVTAGLAVAVLIDDATDADHLLDLLPASPHALMVIQSAASPPVGVAQRRLRVAHTVAETDAVRLVERLAGPARVRADPSAAVELVRRCGGIPLAVVLAAPCWPSTLICPWRTWPLTWPRPTTNPERYTP